MSAASSAFDKSYAAFLFDMDGTILNSTIPTERIWSKWAEAHGLDVAAFMPTMHGVRAIDTITRLGLPGVDPAVEAASITEEEINDVEGVVALAGAVAFLQSLPAEKWAIVTSAPLELAKRRLEKAGIPVPRTLVTAEDVKIGKPNPDCYLLGARKLGVEASDCLVFEDAIAGILAGDAAKADVMVITATHKHPVETAHSTIPDYENVVPRVDQDGRLLVVKTA